MTKVLGVVPALGLVAALSAPEPSAPDALKLCWDAIQNAPNGSAPPSCLVEVATALAPRVLEGLDDVDRARLGYALAAAVHERLDRTASLERVEETRDADRSSYRVTLRASGDEDDGDGDARELVLHRRAGGWNDVRWNGDSLVAQYREVAERLVSRYSFEYLLGELRGEGVVTLADFEHDGVGHPPRGWKRRSFGDDDGRTPYVVREESSGNRFLRAEVRDENVMLYKEVRWNARKYPYVAWRWRVRQAPEGSDERVDSKNDSAAGMYLTYRRKLGLVPETIKFVWSLRHPEGTSFRRPGMGMPWTVVASAGEADGRWHEVVYHTRDLYEETFGGDPGERPLGIGVLTDANDTKSFAAADYDDFTALTTARSSGPPRRR